MTNEEAIAKLEDVAKNILWACGEYSEALEAAIKALEQQPTEIEEIDFVQEHKKIPVTLDLTPCDDAIGRDAVCNIVNDIRDCISVEGYCAIIERLKKLPPVTPQQKYGKWIAVYQGDEIINYRCSECELGDTNGSTYLYGWDYCRRCGARMVEPQESECDA